MCTQNTNRSFVHNSMKGMMLVILGASLWYVHPWGLLCFRKSKNIKSIDSLSN